MTTVTPDAGGSPEPKPSYSPYLLLHNVLRILAADNCEITITTENVGPAMRAAKAMLLPFGIEPTLLARSRHASVRSLERYARPGPEAVARHVATSDPAARRRYP
jgi:hypothetical protein